MNLSDYPIQHPIPWKPIALIGGAAVVVIVAIVVVVRLVNREEPLVLTPVDQARQAVEACEGSKDPAGCRREVVTQVATRGGSFEPCELLEEGKERDTCAWSVARETFDASACGAIAQADKAAQCKDGVAEKLALSQREPALCEAIADSERRGRCQGMFAEPLTSENCGERAPEACEDSGWYEAAMFDADPKACDQIVDADRREACRDDLQGFLERSADEDGDGLNTAEEERYGTDPENPDSDGDTYLDGAEVDAGYDPSGPGRLE